MTMSKLTSEDTLNFVFLHKIELDKCLDFFHTDPLLAPRCLRQVLANGNYHPTMLADTRASK